MSRDKAIELVEKAIEDCETVISALGRGWWDATLVTLNQALAELKAKPPAGKFTKKFRELITLSEEHLSDNKIGRLRTYGKEACVRLDQQAEDNKNQAAKIERLKEQISQQEWKIEGLTAIIQNTEGKIVIKEQDVKGGEK